MLSNQNLENIITINPLQELKDLLGKYSRKFDQYQAHLNNREMYLPD
jgi:hypothetical protein